MADSEEIRLPLKEARRSLDHSINSVDKQADHAIELIKIDLILLGSLPIVQNFGATIPDIYIVFVTLGVATGIMLNFFAYYMVNSIIGLNSEGIEKLIDDSDDEVSQRLSVAYSRWIAETGKTNKRVRKLLAAGIGATVFSIGGLVGGIIF